MRNSDWRHVFIEPKLSVACIETLGLTLLGMLLGYLFKPNDPYFAVLGFSWLMFGPFLSSLRFGLMFGVGSLAALALFWITAQYSQFSWAIDFPYQLGLYLLMIVYVTGEFRNYWYRRVKRLNAATLYINERFSEVSNALNMLKQSHDRLEQMLAAKVSLRESIANIRRQILTSQVDKTDFYGLGEMILKSLAELGSLQSVSLHKFEPRTNNVKQQPEAVIGKPASLDLNNPILLKAIESRKTVALKLDLITENDQTLLLAIPLVDVYNTIYGVIAVNKLPFRAYRAENIQLLSVLGGYIGDLLNTKIQPDKVVANESQQCFLMQARRCMQDVNDYGLSATLIGFEFSQVRYAEKLVQLISQQQRGLDQCFSLKNRAGNQTLMLILPLTDQMSAESYLVKLKNNLVTTFGTNELDTIGFHYVWQALEANNPLAYYMQLLAYDLNIDNIFNE